MNLNLNPKVGYATAAGAGISLLVWGLNQFAHITLPPEVSAALTTLVTFAVGYQTSATKAS